MAGSIQEATSNSYEVSSFAQQTYKIADKGGQAVVTSIDGMKSISEKVFHTAGKIRALGEQSKQINEIVLVIDENAASSERVSAATQEISASTEVINSSAQNVYEISEYLRNLIFSFKL